MNFSYFESIEYWSAIWDFLIGYILLPYVVLCVLLSIMDTIIERKDP